MLSFDRRQQILDILKQRRSATVDFLSRRLYVSAPTIRRDLAQMEEDGMILRVRGGAALLEGTNQDAPLLVRTSKNEEKKLHIANIAQKYVSDSCTLFLDSSSTVTVLAEKLDRFQNLSIVTNGTATIQLLNEASSAKIFSCGGIIQNKSSIVGPHALQMINRFHADILFFSCCGLSTTCGSTEASEDSAAVKKAMFENAKKKIMLCDSTKFGLEFFCKVCSISELDAIITDRKPSDEFLHNSAIPILY